MKLLLGLLVGLCVLAPVALFAGEEPVTIPMADGYGLDAKVASDGKAAADVKRVVVLVHGSGAQNMDEDLTAAAKDGAKVVVFKDLSDALVAKGFAVVRYNKRAFQALQAIKADPKFKDQAQFKAFAKDPFGYFVADVKSVADFALKRFPKAKLYLLGHSEGTYIALQAARERGGVSGVALISFSGTALECLVMEQIVYRPLALFETLDENRDGALDAKELGAQTSTAAALRAQLPVLDLDASGKLERLEFQAGNFSNLLRQPLIDPSATAYEAAHPTAAQLVKDATYPICFFQGLWDNQTPAYQTKAVELLNRNVWKKANLHFDYFEKAGHALDPRDRYEEVTFRSMPTATREKVAGQMNTMFAE